MSTSIIRGLELHYARLVKSHSPFGSEVWDVQVRTEDDDVKTQLEDAGVKMKAHTDGYWYAGIKRNVMNRKGEPNKAPVIVDANKQPIDPDIAIGNGSIGNLKLFSYDWSVGGRSGKSAMLSAVQITNLIEYKGGDDVDFDIEDAEGF